MRAVNPRTTSRPVVLGVAGLLILAFAACGARNRQYDQSLTAEGPYGANSNVVALNATDQSLIIVPPGQTASVIDLPASPRNLTLTPDGTVALVATGDATDPGLTLVGLTGVALGTRADIALPAGPDVIHVSPDGHFALLTYSAAASTSSVGILNPNEIVVVDLSSHAAQSVALGTDSPAPTGVAFAVPGEGGIQLAAVLFDKGLAVVDLGTIAGDGVGDGGQPEVLTVPVRVNGGPEVSPLKALFSSFVNGVGYLYVLAAQSDDVIAVSITTGSGTMTGAINFLSGGQGLTDIALPLGEPPPASIQALYGTEAVQLDASGVAQNQVSATIASGASQLMPAGNGLTLVVGQGQSSVTAWDPSAGAVTALTLDGPASLIAPSPDGNTAIAAVAGSDGPELVVIEIGKNSLGPRLTATPLLLAGSLSAFVFDATGGEVYFVESGQSLLARLNLDTLAHVQATLDATPQSVGLVTGSPGAVFVSETETFGKLVTFPTSAFDAATSNVNPALGEAYPDFLLTSEVDHVHVQ
jgi:hypothetical protein